VKSVRLDPKLQARLKQAARLSGVTESDFIRAAITERSNAALTNDLEGRLAGLVGAVHSKGGRARQAHERYGDILKARKARIQKSQP
jgi:Ribbon-helix-helix protein, copG family